MATAWVRLLRAPASNRWTTRKTVTEGTARQITLSFIIIGKALTSGTQQTPTQQNTITAQSAGAKRCISTAITCRALLRATDQIPWPVALCQALWTPDSPSSTSGQRYPSLSTYIRGRITADHTRPFGNEL